MSNDAMAQQARILFRAGKPVVRTEAACSFISKMAKEDSKLIEMEIRRGVREGQGVRGHQ